MATALIGYTGFVGGNINHQKKFDDLYNSKNISSIEGKEYDLVVSAANRAEMWRINQEPEKDLAEINEFIDHIKKTKIKKLVLISTVGVYKATEAVDEETPIEIEDLPPYGVHRYHLETFCRENFDTTIVRLPGLFGDGLKKNIIYDLLHNNNVERLHPQGMYQYYNLAHIWRDIQIALDNSLSLVNLAVPPVSTEQVASYAFGQKITEAPAGITPAKWDVRTKYATMYGQKADYICTLQDELNEIKQFVEHEKALLS